MSYVPWALFFVSISVSSVSILPFAFAQDSTILPPLTQIENGMAVHDVKCKVGLVLVIKMSDESPACVRHTTAQSLIERGWGIIKASTMPKISQEQAFQTVKTDLLKHVPSIDRILHYGDRDLSSPPNFKKYPLLLYYESPSDIQFRINATDYTLIAECNPKKTYCFIPDDYRIGLIRDKLAYVVATDSFTKDHYIASNYLVDALNGNILYSDLSKDMSELNRTGEYRP